MVKKATLYRMVTDEHVCPYGIKSKYLLEKNGYDVEDRLLKSRQEVDNFKKDHQVETSPQTFIEGERIGGYDDLQIRFGKKDKKEASEKSYTPIVAIFSVTFLMSLALSWAGNRVIIEISTIELFVSISMCVLAILKLRDLDSFSNQFITYDIVGRRWVPYAYIYPFIEGGAGIAMLGKVFLSVFAPLSFLIGLIGAISVVKAVYVEKRDLKCACVGGDSHVPLGFVSLTENLFMIAMGIWMLV